MPPSQSVEQQLVNPGRVRRHGDPMDLVHLAEAVMTADQFLRATTGGKLMVIVEQIRALQDKVCVCVDSQRSNKFSCTIFYEGSGLGWG